MQYFHLHFWADQNGMYHKAFNTSETLPKFAVSLIQALVLPLHHDVDWRY
jgi:hypothetical protein